MALGSQDLVMDDASQDLRGCRRVSATPTDDHRHEAEPWSSPLVPPSVSQSQRRRSACSLIS